MNRLLEIQFFSVKDVFLVPLCLIILYAIIRNRANACSDPSIRKLYFRAFSFKVIFVIAFTFITEFYFGGGDTNLYYQGVKDLRTALSDNPSNAMTIIHSSQLSDENPLAPYFLYDNYAFDITYNYMRSPANFFMPRFGLLPSLVFFNSYLCIALCFGFFALGGAIRLFKTFYYYYPALKRELALATLFLPSVGFWSGGLLKDTICFGCVGFFLYGVFNIFVRKRKFIPSIIWIIVCGYLLFTIKTYIFLVLVLAITIWMFAETNRLIKEKTLRQVFAFLTFTVGLALGAVLLQYFTASDTLRQYQFENVISSAEYQRSNYEAIDQMQQGSSYYSVNTSNPFLLIVNSIFATFFRPFLWEVKTAAALLSSVEALGFLLLTVFLLFKIGVMKFFRLVFREPKSLMCFVFAIVFAVGVGASTANFGALSRYKIPCMPFYMIMLILTYNSAASPYPKWFKWILRKLYKN